MARKSLPIDQLPSGRYRLRYYDTEGKRRTKTFDTVDAAKTAYVQARADISRGQWIDPDDSSTTFADYAAEWVKAQPWAYGTITLVDSNLRNHILPVLGSMPLGKIRPTQCQALISGLAGRLAPRTIDTVLQHLRSILHAAVRDRMIVRNPAADVKVPRAEKPELVIPTTEQVTTILAAIEDRSRALVAVGAGLGLRQGEAFGLSLDRVDFLRREVRIDRQLVRLEHGSALGPLKTPRSYRTIPLPDSVGFELARHIERHPGDDPDGLLFQAAQGGRLRRDGWNRRTWKPAVVAAGRVELGFHSLRHYYASLLIRSGLSAPAVARRLGNSPQMVLDVYAHLWLDDDDRTRIAVDESLASTASAAS